MCIGVIADLMAFAKFAADQLRMIFGIDADDEESRGHVVRFQYVEDGWRVFGVGAVVECQTEDLAFGSAAVCDHPGAGCAGVLFAEIILIGRWRNYMALAA